MLRPGFRRLRSEAKLVPVWTKLLAKAAVPPTSRQPGTLDPPVNQPVVADGQRQDPLQELHGGPVELRKI
jgi:hypothetical protein